MAKLRLLTSVAVMVAMLMAALPATAFAQTKATVICSLAVQVVAPGIDVVKEKKNHFDIRNSGQMLAGVLLCGDPDLDGIVSTLHSSKVKDEGKTGAFEGKIEGELTLVTFSDPSETLTGNLKAKVSGVMAVPGDPTTVFTETVKGNLNLKGVDIKLKVKEFSITLAPEDLVDEFGALVFAVIVGDVGGTPIYLINVGDSVTSGMPDLVLALQPMPGVFVDPTTFAPLGTLVPLTLSPLPTLAGATTLEGELKTVD